MATHQLTVQWKPRAHPQALYHSLLVPGADNQCSATATGMSTLKQEMECTEVANLD